MARGEPNESSGDNDRGVGLAIGAILGAAGLATALLVVGLDTDDSPPPRPARREPLAWADRALHSLTWRGCDGPREPHLASAGTEAAARLHADLAARGYEPRDDWSEPRALPLTADLGTAEGECGVIAVAAQIGAAVNEARIESGAETQAEPPWPTCSSEMAAIGGCGVASVHFFGSGEVRLRRYLMPGLREETVHRLGLPAEVALAHAEAEVLLRAVNWRGHPELVPGRVGPGPGEQEVVPPRAPSSGCVPWVAVGLGVGRATAQWPGGPLVQDMAERRFMAGIVSCGRGASGEPTRSTLRVWSDGGDGRIWLRAFEVGQGPATPGAPQPLLVGTELREPDSATLPAAVPR